MKPYYEEAGSTLYHGDCLAVLPQLPEGIVDTVITDPPYHLTSGKNGGTGAASLNPDSPAGRSRIGTGFMGKAWDGGDVAFRVETWQAVMRVCKPGAFLLAFGGTRTFHRLTVAIEDAGWELRDCMMWLYASGFPKSLDVSKALDKAAGAEREVVGTRQKRGLGGSNTFAQDEWTQSQRGIIDLAITNAATDAARLWSGWGTALKPAWEPIIVAMKPLDGTFAQNALRHGVAGLNIDGGRIGTNGEHLQGSTVRNDIRGGNFATGHKPNPGDIPDYRQNGGGRWPANILLDEQAAELLDQQSGTLASGKMKAGTQRAAQDEPGSVCYGTYGGNATNADTIGDSGGASRFFYTAKASKSDRGHSNDHPTVKPTNLLKYLCKLTSTPTGGLILDPFTGSGTTLVAAREVGRPCIGIEMEESHCKIVVDRLRQGVLFGATL